MPEPAPRRRRIDELTVEDWLPLARAIVGMELDRYERLARVASTDPPGDQPCPSPSAGVERGQETEPGGATEPRSERDTTSIRMPTASPQND